MSNTSAPAMSLENPGIDPGTSRMLSGRSTIWANSPNYICCYKIVTPDSVTEYWLKRTLEWLLFAVESAVKYSLVSKGM